MKRRLVVLLVRGERTARFAPAGRQVYAAVARLNCPSQTDIRRRWVAVPAQFADDVAAALEAAGVTVENRLGVVA